MLLIPVCLLVLVFVPEGGKVKPRDIRARAPSRETERARPRTHPIRARVTGALAARMRTYRTEAR